MNKESKGLDTMHAYQQRSVVKNGADPKDVAITSNGHVVVGKFVDIERPTFWEHHQRMLDRAQGKQP